MTILTWPASIKPNRLTWHLRANTASFVSPLTRQSKTVEFAGAQWVADITIPVVNETKWRAYSALIAQLRGASGRVYVNPWHSTGISAPTYSLGYGATADDTTPTADSTTPTADEIYVSSLGTPLVNGASQTGTSLVTDGWTGLVMVALAGDFISYDTSAGRTLHMVVSDAQSNFAGQATLTVEPPIRTSPADNAVINITNPSCVMRLSDDDTGAPEFMPGTLGTAQLRLIETFND